MRILVDTGVLCALLANPERLSNESRAELAEAAATGELCISIASVLQLREAHRLGSIHDDDMAVINSWTSANQPPVLGVDMRVVASMSQRHSAETLTDRLIIATARAENCRLATFREFDDPDIEILSCT